MHLTDEDLSRYLRAEAPDTPEASAVRAHLEGCALCRERRAALEAFLADIAAEPDRPLTESEQRLADALQEIPSGRLLTPGRRVPWRRHDAIATFREPGRSALTRIPFRMMILARRYPLPATGISLALVAALAMILWMGRSITDRNPAYVEISKGILSVYNAAGERLWTRSARGAMEGTSSGGFPLPGVGPSQLRLLILDDLDGDGRREIVLTGSGGMNVANPDITRDSAYCFDADGRLRWTAGGGPMASIPAVGVTAQTHWLFGGLAVYRASPADRPRLLAVAQAGIFWPSKVMELSPVTGAVTQSYWNAGGISCIQSVDVNGDGRPELLLGGINNAYRRACLIVLDIDRMDGVAPSHAPFIYTNARQGGEMAFVLLPRTDLSLLRAKAIYNTIYSIDPLSSNSFVVFTLEVPGDSTLAGGILYTFDRGLRVTAVSAADNYTAMYERLKKEGQVTQVLDSAYFLALQHRVEYWDGKAFVARPTLRSPGETLAIRDSVKLP